MKNFYFESTIQQHTIQFMYAREKCIVYIQRCTIFFRRNLFLSNPSCSYVNAIQSYYSNFLQRNRLLSTTISSLILFFKTRLFLSFQKFFFIRKTSTDNTLLKNRWSLGYRRREMALAIIFPFQIHHCFRNLCRPMTVYTI